MVVRNANLVRAGMYQGFAPGDLLESVEALIDALESNGLKIVNNQSLKYF